ncbi:hypothetical protein NEMIN01_1815 [Nematocida minor]|uniref:uncharacterized protein n=1 Tax=Nematocida minor TaxID=1912983 RepID=UPI00222008B0|nr:uncharacterized protein NEMIN01_1815 [Nematocida minor]KAI5192119.1 hypothetical protein NEMIN01_1815 [Nematocida minor]
MDIKRASFFIMLLCVGCYKCSSILHSNKGSYDVTVPLRDERSGNAMKSEDEEKGCCSRALAKAKKYTCMAFTSVAKRKTAVKLVFISLGAVAIALLYLRIRLDAKVEEKKFLLNLCHEQIENSARTCYSKLEGTGQLEKMGILKYNGLFGSNTVKEEVDSMLCSVSLYQENGDIKERDKVIQYLSEASAMKIVDSIKRYIEGNHTLTPETMPSEEELERISRLFIISLKRKVRVLLNLIFSIFLLEDYKEEAHARIKKILEMCWTF